ncbi:hypothetical protein BJ170DRAFT_714487 [Xylariales sp. AK1849]|nr:hypothetical protein BJ170DRAFT_714487 [Xylariales sp. AK1849]
MEPVGSDDEPLARSIATKLGNSEHKRPRRESSNCQRELSDSKKIRLGIQKVTGRLACVLYCKIRDARSKGEKCADVFKWMEGVDSAMVDEEIPIPYSLLNFIQSIPLYTQRRCIIWIYGIMHAKLIFASLAFFSMAHGWTIDFYGPNDSGCTGDAKSTSGDTTESCVAVPDGYAYATASEGDGSVHSNSLCTDEINPSLSCTPVSPGNYIDIVDFSRL